MKYKKYDYTKEVCTIPRLSSMEPVGSYPFNANDMDDYLSGVIPVPSGSANREFNGIPLDEVTYYARDNFEAIEAMKSAVRNAHEETERAQAPNKGSSVNE